MKSFNGFSTAIVINPPFEIATDSWWTRPELIADRAAFSLKVIERTAALSSRYGSAPMSTSGPIDPGFSERARRTRDEQERRAYV